VECEVFQNAAALHIDDFALVVHEVVDGEILLERVVDTVETALLEAGKIECGFAKGLAGNGAGVDAASTHVLGALDDGNGFAEIGSLRAPLFTGGATADHDQIELVVRGHTFLRGALELGQVIASRRIVGEVGARRRSFLSTGIGEVSVQVFQA